MVDLRHSVYLIGVISPNSPLSLFYFNTAYECIADILSTDEHHQLSSSLSSGTSSPLPPLSDLILSALKSSTLMTVAEALNEEVFSGSDDGDSSVRTADFHWCTRDMSVADKREQVGQMSFKDLSIVNIPFSVTFIIFYLIGLSKVS